MTHFMGFVSGVKSKYSSKCAEPLSKNILLRPLGIALAGEIELSIAFNSYTVYGFQLLYEKTARHFAETLSKLILPRPLGGAKSFILFGSKFSRSRKMFTLLDLGSPFENSQNCRQITATP